MVLPHIQVVNRIPLRTLLPAQPFDHQRRASPCDNRIPDCQTARRSEAFPLHIERMLLGGCYPLYDLATPGVRKRERQNPIYLVLGRVLDLSDLRLARMYIATDHPLAWPDLLDWLAVHMLLPLSILLRYPYRCASEETASSAYSKCSQDRLGERTGHMPCDFAQDGEATQSSIDPMHPPLEGRQITAEHILAPDRRDQVITWDPTQPSIDRLPSRSGQLTHQSHVSHLPDPTGGIEVARVQPGVRIGVIGISIASHPSRIPSGGRYSLTWAVHPTPTRPESVPAARISLSA